MRRSAPFPRLAGLLAIALLGTGCDIMGPIGSYPAERGEAVVRLYPTREADPSELVDSVMAAAGEYRFFLGQNPGTDLCDYWVHVERWDGVVLEPTDLFPDRSAPCTLDVGLHQGARIALPHYDPLTEPFTLGGRIFVDGDSTASAGLAGTIPSFSP